MSAPVLSIRGLRKSFGRTDVLRGVELDVAPGEFVVVLGATGAGKTTLLRLVAGLEKPDAGSLQLGGRDALELAPAQRDVALVFQNFSLYPSRTVRENLAFPLRAPGRALSERDVDERVREAARLLAIERLLDRPSRQLSGGEMQRVAIGRAIVRRPRLFLMDEPLSNLDAKLREELRSELRELARKLATPVLWVTHDQLEALSMADRVAVLAGGRVLQYAAPELVYREPTSPAVARLLGSPPINVFEVERRGDAWHAADGTRICAAKQGDPQRARLGVRPEQIELAGGASSAVVEVVADLGPARVLVIAWAGARVHALVERASGARPGDRVHPRVLRTVVWPLDAS